MTVKYRIVPDTSNTGLYSQVGGIDQTGLETDIQVIEERPLTIFINSQEVITAMTVGDYPKYLAIGFLYNQQMLKKDEKIISVDYEAEVNVVVVRTKKQTNFESKLRKKTKTSGCAVGTIFGDIMEGLTQVILPDAKIYTSWIYKLSFIINTTKSLYLKVGAIHGTVLCCESEPICFMEDVGRHNAVDKIAGWMIVENISPADKILYTTGRLTSEMVIKTANMGIPILISRSGFSAWGVKLAKDLNMTLIGRLRGKRFICLSGSQRLVYDVEK